MKRCSSCKKGKELYHFYKSRTRKDGYCPACKSCEKVRNKIRRQTPKDKYVSYKGRAKFKKQEFKLSFEEFMNYWQKPCYYCDSEIKTIGLDRIDYKRGYLFDNIIACCTSCNSLKGYFEKGITMHGGGLIKRTKRIINMLIIE